MTKKKQPEEKFCAACEVAIRGGKTHEVCQRCLQRLKAPVECELVPVPVNITQEQAFALLFARGLMDVAAQVLPQFLPQIFPDRPQTCTDCGCPRDQFDPNCSVICRCHGTPE